MKKIYSKPEIAFESFSLSENIAGNCEITEATDPRLEFTGLGHAFTTSCSYPVPDQVGGDGEYNGICYHVFSENAWGNVFTS